ncbi:hypothetical protein ACS3UN_06525 [Oscillospiraceae bacterium LTW-04]|nr:hypothetical protein RBH76_03835 [Oscillospiraceae bacterium MB24-C1]
MPITPDIPLSEELEVVDTSLVFQAMALMSGIIAMAVSCILRENLAGTLTLDNCEEFSLLKTRTAAGIIVFVALIYFFLLSIQTLNEAVTPCDGLSGKVNLMASFLVLVASALRLYDLTAIAPRFLSEPEALEIEELPLL